MEVIKIGAMWCGSCLVMKKMINELQDEYKDITFTSLDLDFDKDKISKYDVGNVIPVIFIYKDGKELEKLVGDSTKEQVISAIERCRLL